MAVESSSTVLSVTQKDNERFRIAGVDMVDVHRPLGRHSVTSTDLVNDATGFALIEKKSGSQEQLVIKHASLYWGFPRADEVSTPDQYSNPDSHRYETTARLWNFDPEHYDFDSEYGEVAVEHGEFPVQTGAEWVYDGRIVVPHNMGVLTVYFANSGAQA
jgi:hypothetical protein